MELNNKIFVVTGGGNGMGREVTLLLLQRGARVAALDLNEAGLAETAALAGAGERLSTHAMNITDRAAVEALPATVEATHGAPADGVINVAGIIHRFAKIQDLSLEEIERVINVNYWGTVYVTMAFLPVLLSRPTASITNFASMGALIPFPGQGAYGSSKGAVKLFTETLLAELQDTNVQVSIVYPGAIGTNITGNSGVTTVGSTTPDDAQKSSMKPMAPAEAGRLIVDGIQRGTFRIFVGNDAKTFDRLSRLMPTRAITMIAKKVGPMLGL